jgi:hypothetical protein
MNQEQAKEYVDKKWKELYTDKYSSKDSNSRAEVSNIINKILSELRNNHNFTAGLPLQGGLFPLKGIIISENDLITYIGYGI